MPIDGPYDADLGEITTEMMQEKERVKEREKKMRKPGGAANERQRRLVELRGGSVPVTDGRRCPS